MSRSGHGLRGDYPQLDADDLIDANEVARMLGCSKRQARRHARDLDGQIIGGRWVFRKAAVAEYAEGRG